MTISLSLILEVNIPWKYCKYCKLWRCNKKSDTTLFFSLAATKETLEPMVIFIIVFIHFSLIYTFNYFVCFSVSFFLGFGLFFILSVFLFCVLNFFLILSF